MTTAVPTELPDRVAAVLAPLPDRLDGITACYEDFHQHPELSRREDRTAARMAELLASYGYDVTEGVGGHGVVGVLPNGDGPVLLLRADMDGLPITERTGLPYASTETAADEEGRTVGVSHACGHDSHLACLLGAADLLAAAREHWRGTLLLIVQPAEETASGALAMLRDGLYRRFPKPDVALGQHVVPLPAGVLGHRGGPMMAAAAELRVTIFGSGGHGATPHTTIDPIVIAGHVITRLQTIVARELDPAGFGVVTVGVVRAGTRANVIPDQAELGVTVRAFSDDVQARLIAAVERIVAAEAAAGGARREPTVSVVSKVPVNVNSDDQLALVRAAHEAVLGDDRVITAPALSASEDFPYFGSGGEDVDYAGAPVPTVFWLLGGTAQDVWRNAPGDTPAAKLASLPVNHSPEFAPDPVPTMHTGVTALVAAAMAFLPAAS